MAGASRASGADCPPAEMGSELPSGADAGAAPGEGRPSSLFFAPDRMWMPIQRRILHERQKAKNPGSHADPIPAGASLTAAAAAPAESAGADSSDDSFVSAESTDGSDLEDKGDGPQPGMSAWDTKSPFDVPSPAANHMGAASERPKGSIRLRTMQNATEVLAASRDGVREDYTDEVHPHTQDCVSCSPSANAAPCNHEPVSFSPIENWYPSSVGGFNTPESSWMDGPGDCQGALPALSRVPRLSDRLKSCFASFGSSTPRCKSELLSEREDSEVAPRQATATPSGGRLWDPYTPLKPKAVSAPDRVEVGIIPLQCFCQTRFQCAIIDVGMLSSQPRRRPCPWHGRSEVSRNDSQLRQDAPDNDAHRPASGSWGAAKTLSSRTSRSDVQSPDQDSGYLIHKAAPSPGSALRRAAVSEVSKELGLVNDAVQVDGTELYSGHEGMGGEWGPLVREILYRGGGQNAAVQGARHDRPSLQFSRRSASPEWQEWVPGPKWQDQTSRNVSRDHVAKWWDWECSGCCDKFCSKMLYEEHVLECPRALLGKRGVADKTMHMGEESFSSNTTNSTVFQQHDASHLPAFPRCDLHGGTRGSEIDSARDSPCCDEPPDNAPKSPGVVAVIAAAAHEDDGVALAKFLGGCGLSSAGSADSEDASSGMAVIDSPQLVHERGLNHSEPSALSCYTAVQPHEIRSAPVSSQHTRHANVTEQLIRPADSLFDLSVDGGHIDRSVP